MSIWNRLLGVMVVMLAAVGGLLFWQSRVAGQGEEELLRANAEERIENFNRVNRIISRSLESFALEVGSNQLEALPPLRQLEQSAVESQVDFFAILKPDISIAAQSEVRGKLQPVQVMPDQSVLRFLVGEGQRALFFTPSSAGPVQFAFSPLAESDGSVSGYVLAGRYWDRLFLTNLGQATESVVLSLPVEMISRSSSGFENGFREYQIAEVGLGAMGQPVFAYTATFDLQDQLAIIERNNRGAHRIAFAVLGVLVLFFAMLWKWLAYPISLVSDALEKDDPTVLQPILNEGYDWSRIAQRLAESSEARLELTREVRRQQEQARIQEETARVRETLARDLHDGVIQSVYAVGLQLERATIMLNRDPEKSRQRIDDCKLSLNGIIGELRGFIKGLTPEPLRGKSLCDALEQLVIHSRKSTEAEIQMNIDPEACDELNAAQALNLYQLSRELLSNAIRHAQASSIRFRLFSDGASVILRVTDDGVGFDPEAMKSGGYGLTNLQERARQIGAIVKVMPNAPAGSIVQVSTPIISEQP